MLAIKIDKFYIQNNKVSKLFKIIIFNPTWPSFLSKKFFGSFATKIFFTHSKEYLRKMLRSLITTICLRARPQRPMPKNKKKFSFMNTSTTYFLDSSKFISYSLFFLPETQFKVSFFGNSSLSLHLFFSSEGSFMMRTWWYEVCMNTYWDC